MFFLKSLISFFVLPPLNLVLAILVGLAVLRARPCLGRRLIGVSSVLLLLLAVPVVGNAMLVALERNLPTTPPSGKPPGAIVILGAELHWTANPPGVEVGRLTLQRLRAGAALYRKTHLPILVTGGLVGDAGPPVATVMAESLRQDFHVPVRWVEAHSRDTWENARDSAAILRAAGISSVYVVTHAWHERRALIAFRRAGLTATAAPTGLDRLDSFTSGALVPSASVWMVSYYALHEWVGCVWYSLP